MSSPKSLNRRRRLMKMTILLNFLCTLFGNKRKMIANKTKILINSS